MDGNRRAGEPSEPERLRLTDAGAAVKRIEEVSEAHGATLAARPHDRDGFLVVLDTCICAHIARGIVRDADEDPSVEILCCAHLGVPFFRLAGSVARHNVAGVSDSCAAFVDVGYVRGLARELRRLADGVSTRTLGFPQRSGPCSCRKLGCQARLTDMSLIAQNRMPTKPIEALRELVRAINECDVLKRETVAAAREAGATWEAIGEALGITRQSAWALYSVDAAAISADLAANVANNTDLSEDEALDIAVEEVRQVRRARRAR